MLGQVEEFQRRRIRGWAHDPDAAGPTKVEVWLGGRKLRTLRTEWKCSAGAVRPAGKVGFRFRIHPSLWEYVHTTDALSFRVRGEELPILRNELDLLSTGKRKPVELLFSLLDEGYIITKKGAVKLSIDLDIAWQEKVLDWYGVAREKFRAIAGYDLYVVSGTLLGIVRENNFVAGDDDFDTGYLSSHSDPFAIRDEMAGIMKALQDSGEHLRLGRRLNLFHWKSPDGTEIDVFPSWTRGEKYFLTFAVGAGCGAAMRKGFVEREFRGRQVLVPIEAEALLEGSYGPDWRVPDPLFQWVVPRATRREMHKVKLTDAQIAWIWGLPPPAAAAEATQAAAKAGGGQEPDEAEDDKEEER